MNCVVCGERAVATVVFIPVCQIHRDEYMVEAEKQLPTRERAFFWKLVDLDYQQSLKNLCTYLENE